MNPLLQREKLGTLQREIYIYIYTSIYYLYMDYIMACFGAIWVNIWGTTTKALLQGIGQIHFQIAWKGGEVGKGVAPDG